MTDPRVRIELEAVASMIENFDYYQVLKAPQTADRRSLERAFVNESRRFHPDRYQRTGDPDLMALATKVYRRISEAWSVLRDPQLRAAYDRRIAQGLPTERLTKADLEQEAQQAAAGVTAVGVNATTANGKKYLEMAQRAERAGDLKQAIMHAQFASNSEAGNQPLADYVTRLKEMLASAPKQASAKSDNPYKID